MVPKLKILKKFYLYRNKNYHFSEQDSSAEPLTDLSQKYMFIPLDIFRKNKQNKTINRFLHRSAITRKAVII